METHSSEAAGSPEVFQAKLLVECPACHSHHWMDFQSEIPLGESAPDIRRQMEMWLASHCPEHLAPLLKWSRN